MVYFDIWDDHDLDLDHRHLTLTLNIDMHKNHVEDNYDNHKHLLFNKNQDDFTKGSKSWIKYHIN
jgi:hypothetical protein